MNWYENPVSLTTEAAAVIAAGMREVAQADGDVHDRELALIGAFGGDAEGGSVEDAGTALDSDEVRAAYVRSLVMVALADGVISDVEEARIRELAGAVGFGVAEIEELTLDVKRFFLAAFSGVQVFREAVVQIATDLGLPPSEVDALGA